MSPSQLNVVNETKKQKQNSNGNLKTKLVYTRKKMAAAAKVSEVSTGTK